MATDKELVERIQSGESEAYAELFRRYYQDIYTICVSMVSNAVDAEELAQEMFVHAYLKVGQLRDPAKFFPWLKKMARNRSRNFLQRTKTEVIPLSLVEMKRSSSNPDEEVLRYELIQAIMEAIEALPDKDRQIVRARIDGLSHSEISRRFNISQRASLSRLYRARRKLSDHLKGLYSVLGLSKILHIKEISSGGVVAVKIGIGAKVSIGVLGALAVGFAGFQIVTQKPDQEILPPTQTIQETSTERPRIPEIDRQKTDKRYAQILIDKETESPDLSEESVGIAEVGNPPETDGIHTGSAIAEDISQRKQDGKPWKSDPEYQQLEQEFQTKRKLNGEVSSRRNELAKKLNQLPKRVHYKSRKAAQSDPEYQKRLSLAEEHESLAWQSIALYKELKELWAAMEAIKQSHMEEEEP